MTVTLKKNGGTKILSKDSGLVEKLIADGWKKSKEVKEAKNGKSNKLSAE